MVFVLLVALFSVALGVSVGSVGGCSTSAVSGLNRQLISMMPRGLFADISKAPYNQCIAFGGGSTPYLQTKAADALLRACKAARRTVRINSALRSIPQQALLYNWYRQGGRCGIRLAAAPGNSNHQSGGAIDIQDANSWISTLRSHGWTWLGSKDPVHFDYNGRQDVRRASILAFQKLYNMNNSRKIAETGVYDSATASALLRSPAEGFPKGPGGASVPVSSGGGGSSSFIGRACGNGGSCQEVSKCGGTTKSGLCPGPANIKCCFKKASPPKPTPKPQSPHIGKSCRDNSGNTGTCQVASSCKGVTKSGFCPGPSSIKCCFKGRSEAPRPRPVPQVSCRQGGRTGSCMDFSLCSGTVVRGLCPGPSNIRCCFGGGAATRSFTTDNGATTSGGSALTPAGYIGIGAAAGFVLAAILAVIIVAVVRARSHAKK